MFWKYLPVEGWVLAQHRIAGQLALAIVPQADVLVGIQVAGHHEEAKRQLAHVPVAPISGARTTLHQEAIHLPEVALVFVQS